jgi:hypothetical protein
MSRPELRRDPAIASQRKIVQAAAMAMVQSASAASVASDVAQQAVEDAISGDLIAASPELASTIHDITTRLSALEAP